MALIEPDDVHNVLGTSTDDVSTTALEADITTATRYTLRRVYKHVTNEVPKPNPDTGAGVDGSNTLFMVKQPPIADISGSGTPTDDDVSGFWIDSTYNEHAATVALKSARIGTIEITQDGDVALPADANGVYVSYHQSREDVDMHLVAKAAAYYAAHLAYTRLVESDSTNVADLGSNEDKQEADPKRFLREHERLVRKVQTPKAAVVS